MRLRLLRCAQATVRGGVFIGLLLALFALFFVLPVVISVWWGKASRR
jgi:hypothetical protein